MNNQPQAVGYALAAVLCWSTVATAFKLSLQEVGPAQLLAVAVFAAWITLLFALLIRRELSSFKQQNLKDIGRSLLSALLNPLLYYLVLFNAYDLLPAQEAQAINYSWAIVLSILAVPLLGHRFSRYDLVAATLCYFGVLLIATRGNLFTLEFTQPLGIVLALASTFLWSLYWIFNVSDLRSPLIKLFTNFSIALPLVWLYAWISEGLQLSMKGILASSYVGVVEMGLGFIFWMFAMQKTNKTAGIANLIFLSPFLSLFFISTFLEEDILPSTLLALSLIVAGLLLQRRNTVSN